MRQRVSWWPFMLLLILAAHPLQLAAQSVWMQPRHDNQISIEWFKAFTPSGSETDFMSGVYFIDLEFEVGEEMKIVSEVPFVYASGAWTATTVQSSDVVNTERREYEKSLVGNIYAGLEIGSEDRAFFFEVGMRLPTTESMIPPERDNAEEDGYWQYISYLNAIMIGLWSDIERYGAFRPLGVSGEARYVTAQALANYQPELTDAGLGYRLRGGPQFFIPTARGNLEMGLSLTAQGMYRTGSVYFLGGYSGLAALTAENFGIKEGLAHHLILGVSVDLGDAYPGLQLRIPLDNNGSDFFQNSLVFQVGFVMD